MKHVYSVLVGLVLSIVVFLILAIITGIIFQDKVENYVLSELNKNLTTEIITDDIQFSLIKKFPKATLEFINVFAKSDAYFRDYIYAYNTDTAFVADKVFLQFGLMDLIAKNYILQSIELEGGEIHFFIDQSGNHNFEIWSKQPDNEKAISLELQNVVFKNTKLQFIDAANNIEIIGHAKKLSLRGDFTKKHFNLDIISDLKIDKFKTDHPILLTDFPLRLDIALDQDKSELFIRRGKFILYKGQNLTMQGIIGLKENRYYNLDLKGENIRLDDFDNYFAEFSRDLNQKLDFYNGLVDLDIQINGVKDYNRELTLSSHFVLRKMNMLYIPCDCKIEDLGFSGKVDFKADRSKKKYNVILDEVEFETSEQRFIGDLNYSSSNEIQFSLTSAGFFNLNDLDGYLPTDTISDLDGMAKIDIQYAGNSSDFSFKNIFNQSLSANVEIRNGQFRFKNTPFLFSNITGSISADKTLYLDSLYFDLEDNDFLIDGEARNIGNFIHQNGELSIRGDLYSHNLDLDELMGIFKRTNEQTERLYYAFPTNLNFIINLNIENFNLHKYSSSNTSGRLLYKPTMFTLQEISMDVMGGNARVGGVIVQKYDKTFMSRGQSRLQNIEIDDLFFALNNFGQEYLMSENLRGKISGDIFFSSNWSNEIKIMKESILAETNIQIENGELIQFEPMLGLSRYITVDELKHIKFSTLKNRITIKDQVINIPQMDIQSSALNIIGSGEHKFSNDFDYRITLFLNEIIANKLNRKVKQESEFGTIEDDGLGKTKVHLSIKGTPDEYKIKLDRSKMRESRKQNLNEEKQELKQILNEEFGWFSKDSLSNQSEKNKNTTFEIETDDKKSRKKKRKKRKSDEQKFVIEFDEDTTKRN